MQIKRIVSFAALLMLLGSAQVQATYQEDNCCQPCCDYLQPCGWSLQVQGGVSPMVWAQRGDNCCLNSTQLPSFRNLYKVPFVVGGKVGYNLSGCTEVYIEGDYVQARAKSCDVGFTVVCPQSASATATVTSALSKYKAFAVYGGARYYFGAGCLNDCCSCLFDRVSFFVGMQVGFVHHKNIDITLSSVSTSGNAGPLTNTMFLKGNTISAGGNVGIDMAVNDCFSVVLTVEVLGNGASKNCPVICLGTPLPGINANTVVVGRYGTEIWIPITLGLKYNF